MGKISNFICKKIVEVKYHRFKENIDKRIEEAELCKIELYKINNRLKSSLLNCICVDDFFEISINQGIIPYKYTQKIDMNSEEYLYDLRYNREVEFDYHDVIIKYNKIVDSINEYNKIINQYKNVVDDVRCYIEDNKISISSNIMMKFGIVKNEKLICTICNFGTDRIVRIKGLDVIILYGEFHKKKDYGMGMGIMQLDVHLFQSTPSIEVIVIDTRANVKRTRVGSFTIKWLEECIVPEINRRIDKFNNESKSEDGDIKLRYIKKIYGCSGSLNSDTDSYAREKFYTKNGYVMKGFNFEKLIKY